MNKEITTHYSKRIIFIVLFGILVGLCVWRGLQWFGVIRSLPHTIIERREECVTGQRKVKLADLDPRCPFCHGTITAIYYSFSDQRLDEVNNEGIHLWFWQDYRDGSAWFCRKCGRRYDEQGRVIR